MKTRIAILVALATAGVSLGAGAQPDPPLAPSITLALPTGAALAGAPGAAPSLFPSEQGAFKLMEAAAQVIESRNVQNGCVTKDYPISVSTMYDGSGRLVLGNDYVSPDNIVLNSRLVAVNNSKGRRYAVFGAGTIDNLFVSLNGGGSFNIGSSMQEMSNSWSIRSPQTGTLDAFTGTIIKDYKRVTALEPILSGFDDTGVPVSMVLDYGYQQVSKIGFIAAKYWQRSWTWRENSVNSGTYWVKTRVAPQNGCSIEIKLQGAGGDLPNDTIEGFNEVGTVHVGGAPVGAFKIQ